MCPEGRQVFPEMTVMENLQLGAYTRRRSAIKNDLDEMMTLFPRLRERAGQLRKVRAQPAIQPPSVVRFFHDAALHMYLPSDR